MLASSAERPLTLRVWGAKTSGTFPSLSLVVLRLGLASGEFALLLRLLLLLWAHGDLHLVVVVFEHRELGAGAVEHAGEEGYIHCPGACATCVVVWSSGGERLLAVANVGDCRAVISRQVWAYVTKPFIYLFSSTVRPDLHCETKRWYRIERKQTKSRFVYK